MSIMIPAWVDGVLTPTDKLEAHKLGLRHKAVSVFVLRDGQILLQQRALGKYHTPGLWANTCCTHPHWNEDSLECASRRLRDELGIEGLAPQYRHHLEYRADVGNGLIEHEAVDIFLAQADDRLVISANPDEVMDTRWIGYRDLMSEIAKTPEAFTPWLRIYMTDHASVIFGPDIETATAD